jgi:hypothetical protein
MPANRSSPDAIEFLEDQPQIHRSIHHKPQTLEFDPVSSPPEFYPARPSL